MGNCSDSSDAVQPKNNSQPPAVNISIIFRIILQSITPNLMYQQTMHNLLHNKTPLQTQLSQQQTILQLRLQQQKLIQSMMLN